MARVGIRVRPDHDPPSDVVLLGAYCRTGEMEGFRAILERHQGDLLRMAHALLHDGHAAQDAVQEGFMRLIRDADELCARVSWQAEEGGAVGSLGGWLCTVVRHACLDQLRRRKVAPMLSLQEHPGELPTARDLPAGDAEAGVALWQAVEALPVLERAAVVLRYRDGLSYLQIAERLGKSATHVGVLLHQALGRLRGSSALKAGVQP
jgi:RNA polymerase sigma-70 factor (ECF subfamily)